MHFVYVIDFLWKNCEKCIEGNIEEMVYGKVSEVRTCGFPSSVFASVFIFLCSRFKFVKDSLWSWVLVISFDLELTSQIFFWTQVIPS